MDKWPTFTASKYLTAGKNIYDHKITTFDPREKIFCISGLSGEDRGKPPGQDLVGAKPKSETDKPEDFRQF